MIQTAITSDLFVSCDKEMHSALASDLYLVLTPQPDMMLTLEGEVTELARQMYRHVSAKLHATGYRIFCERIFATLDVMDCDFQVTLILLSNSTNNYGL